jgi:predicted phosphoribosyltransferase
LFDLFLFADRSDAGKKLAVKLVAEPLVKESQRDELLVLSIPRGGVVIGAAVAKVLKSKHEVIVVKKISFPGYEELAIGAMAEDGLVTLESGAGDQGWLNRGYLEQAKREVQDRITAQIDKFRQGRLLDLRSKTVIVVDDGIATGETMKAAVLWLRAKGPAEGPRKIIVGTPVCAPPIAAEFDDLADRFVCLATPEWFWAVSQFYYDFDPVDDEEVLAYLQPGPKAVPLATNVTNF